MRQVPADAEGKRFPIGFRTTKAVRDRIEAEAKANGRSMAQEIEFRLEAGYEMTDARKAIERANAVAAAMVGDDKTAAMIRAMSASIGAVLSYSGEHWDRDIYTRAAVKACIDAVRIGSFQDEPLRDLPVEQVDVDLLYKLDKIGRMFGKLMSVSRNDPEQMAEVEAFADRVADGPEADAAEIIASLTKRV